MKMLLFVQTGDARPKVAKQFGAWRGWAEQYFTRIRFGESGQPDRGWLVECANAEAGRRLIEADDGERFAMGSRYGRILASGGKR